MKILLDLSFVAFCCTELYTSDFYNNFPNDSKVAYCGEAELNCLFSKPKDFSEQSQGN